MSLYYYQIIITLYFTKSPDWYSKHQLQQVSPETTRTRERETIMSGFVGPGSLARFTDRATHQIEALDEYSEMVVTVSPIRVRLQPNQGKIASVNSDLK